MNSMKTLACLFLIFAFLAICSHAWKTDEYEEDTSLRQMRRNMLEKYLVQLFGKRACIPTGGICTVTGSTSNCCIGMTHTIFVYSSIM